MFRLTTELSIIYVTGCSKDNNWSLDDKELQGNFS